jgi:hypothetical protein
MSESKTVTIRVPAETYEQIREACGDLGEAFNFNQFVNHSLHSTLEIINHDEDQIPVPRFAMMARFMKNYKAANFNLPPLPQKGGTTNGGSES